MICFPEPTQGDCEGCPATYESPIGYYTGMDLNTCPKRLTCPCGFDPLSGGQCIRIKHLNFKEMP